MAMEPGQHLSDTVGEVLTLRYKKDSQIATVTEMKEDGKLEQTAPTISLKRLSPLPEILNGLLVSHPEAILHVIDELGFHFGK